MKKLNEQYYIKNSEFSFIIFTIKRKIFGGADLYGTTYYIRGDGIITTSENKKYDCDSLGKINEDLKGTDFKNEMDKISKIFNIMSILNNITWYYC